MKLAVLDPQGAQKGQVELPRQFSEPVRADLIKRAVHALQANARQAYGADPRAGKRASAELSRRRRKYRGSYGFGISRVPRKILSRRGTRMYMVGAFAPGTVGGRRAHPPKASKIWSQKLNTRENRKAIRSALAATMDKELVVARGHRVPEKYPFVVDSAFEQLDKTPKIKKALLTLGFKDELARADKTKIRAGKGTMRGRKTKRAKGLLIVTAKKDAPMVKASGNLAGADVITVNELNAEFLAPGTHAGRATLFTKDAIAVMQEKGLFLDTGKKPQAGKPKPVEKPKEEKVEKKAAKAKPAPKEAPAKPAHPTKTGSTHPKTGAKGDKGKDAKKVAKKAPKTHTKEAKK